MSPDGLVIRLTSCGQDGQDSFPRKHFCHHHHSATCQVGIFCNR